MRQIKEIFIESFMFRFQTTRAGEIARIRSVTELKATIELASIQPKGLRILLTALKISEILLNSQIPAGPSQTLVPEQLDWFALNENKDKR